MIFLTSSLGQQTPCQTAHFLKGGAWVRGLLPEGADGVRVRGGGAAGGTANRSGGEANGMRITRKHIANAIEGALTTQKKFTLKTKFVIYTARLIDGKYGVSVKWMPRYRKV